MTLRVCSVGDFNIFSTTTPFAENPLDKSRVIVAVMLFSAGCGSGVGASEKAQAAGKQALTAVDKYLDGESGYSVTRNELDECYDALEYTDDMPTGEKDADWFIRVDILNLGSRLLLNEYGDAADYDELIKSRNSLAEDLGESKR